MKLKKDKNKKAPEESGAFANMKLQAGQHGGVVLGAQIGANLAGLGAAIVDGGEQERSAAQNRRNKENRSHKKVLTFEICRNF